MNAELKSLLTKLNPICYKAFELAGELCIAHNHDKLNIEHLLLRILDSSDTDVQVILYHYEISVPKLKWELTRAIKKYQRSKESTISLSTHVATLLREAWLISSLQFGNSLIRSGAILLVLIDHDSLREHFITKLPLLSKISREVFREELCDLVKHSSEANTPHLNATTLAKTHLATTTTSSKSALEKYTIDLTKKASLGQIEPIEERETEIYQIIDILTRHNQNNPLLIGNAGVGKTAVIEGIALKIAQDKVPPILQNVSICVLNPESLQASVDIKDKFENIIKSISKEIKNAVKPIIWFIDDAHILMNASIQAGEENASHLLKQILVGDELHTIVATRYSGYQKYFENDFALMRRFQQISIDEPNEEIAITMLRSRATNLEKYHKVRITDEAIHEAVRLSSRFISGQHLPEKAISVLDTACAKVSAAQNGTPHKLENTLQRVTCLQKEQRILQREYKMEHAQRLENLNNELNQLQVSNKNLEKRWKNERRMVKKLRELEDTLENLKLEKEISE
ncbi:AAA family ATPase [Candidatus Parabeggiatoa sp. HSG14]|uniref:AAA family ATPase n=1 Tax=Candidatus Parabeggiatoa sp. HSG14 TaxID=3055593 RepID=UPI0025A7C81F|nr:AAA family ATPase [Thiotrichales bacterium HSG14]